MVVMISLLIILALQYRSLSALESMSAAAVRGMVRNFLEVIAADVERFYRADAERALQLSPEALVQDLPDPSSFAFHHAQTAKLFFTSTVSREDPQLRFYHATGEVLAISPDAAMVRAVEVALAPWWMLGRTGVADEPAKLRVDEREPEHRLILKPIRNEASQVIGVIGMVVDPSFFAAYYLPKIIREHLPKLCSDTEQDNMVVTVHDGRDQKVWATQPAVERGGGIVKSLQFVYTDWQLGVHTRHMTPEQWAQQHFALNVSLSLLVTGILVAGIVLILRTASRAVKLSQMKTDFVSNVSHELRTPLASVRVFGEFLRLGRVSGLDKAREYGEYIETESRRLTHLINNILDFAKIESDQKNYQFEAADLTGVITEVIETFHVRLQQRPGKLVFEAPAPMLPPVMIDPDAMAQAVTNLLDNAIKYSAPDRVIRVQLQLQDGWVALSVSDQGIGIPRWEQEKIFERFHRVSTGLVHNVKGSGLGLAIVKHIVSAHRGTVTLTSDVGQGSTFILYLPVINSSPAISTPRTRPLTREASPKAAWWRGLWGHT